MYLPAMNVHFTMEKLINLFSKLRCITLNGTKYGNVSDLLRCKGFKRTFVFRFFINNIIYAISNIFMC